MSVQFHSLTIKEIKKETADCVSISFFIPENLKQSFIYSAGQNITLKKNINDVEVRRSYSICSAPFENEFRIAIKKVHLGKFSTYANDVLQAGEELQVLSPTGKFGAQANTSTQKNYVAFAAGSGITPILSIIKNTLHQYPQSNFTLVYGNKSRASIIFFEALEALKDTYLQRFTVIHILSKEKTDASINFGRINIEKLNALQKLIQFNAISEYFICGPQEMIFTTKDFLNSIGVDNYNIHFELFGTEKKTTTTIAEQKNILRDTSIQSDITIQADGRSLDFKLGFNEANILDAALQHGADLPYACKGGVCCTCKAKLITGEVKMDVHWGLEDEEIEQGFILTCQARPISKTVVIDFDVK
jgi:ring-1,2-phenylacetyl-CoA epoxidase subunit PaaE